MKHEKPKNSEKETEASQQAKDKQSAYAAAAGALGLEKEELLPPMESIEALHQQINELEKKVDEHKDKALRAMAELENTRRIAKRDIGNAHKFALEKFAAELLPVIDSLEQGLAATNMADDGVKPIRDGMELTHKIFLDSLAKHGVESINPLGDIFDPALHEAISMQEAHDAKPNSIVAVVQRGFVLNGRVIRAARVVVAK